MIQLSSHHEMRIVLKNYRLEPLPDIPIRLDKPKGGTIPFPTKLNKGYNSQKRFGRMRK